MRREWAEGCYETYKATRTFERTHEQCVKEWGVFLNFDTVVHKEGGASSPSAVAGAWRYCVACLYLGWWEKNELSGRIEFLYARKGYSDKFATAWRLFG